jgi:hypothetical protein
VLFCKCGILPNDILLSRIFPILEINQSLYKMVLFIMVIGKTSVNLMASCKKAIDKMPLYKMPLDKMPLDKMPLDKMPLDKMPLDKMPLDKMPLEKMPLDKMG